MSAFMGQFREEAKELIEAITQGLLALEKSPNDADTLEEIARAAHTLKGSARLMGLEQINRLTHRLEDMLVAVRDGELAFTAQMADLIFEALDRVSTGAEAAFETGQEGIAVDDLCERIDQAAKGGGAPATQEVPQSLEEAGDEEEQVALEPSDEDEEAPVPPAVTMAEEPEAPEAPVDQLTDSAAPEDEEEEDTQSEPAAFEVFEKRLPKKRGERESEEPLAPEPIPPAVETDRGPEAEPEVAPPPASSEEPPTQHRRAPAAETIRVDTGKLDRLASVAGEMIVSLIKSEAIANAARSAVGMAKDQVRLWQQLRDELRPVVATLAGASSADGSLSKLEELIGRSENANASLLTELERLAHQLNESTMRVATTTRRLEEDVMSVRMRPVSALFNTFPRAVRDMSRDLGRPTNLTIEGGDTELDRKVVEAIRDPLLHLVRNAVGHGIEPQDERARLGKDPEGAVRLAAWQQGDQVFVEISDDGKGIDPPAVREAAVAKGLIDRPTAESLSKADCLRLIFEPGFSTSEAVTDISGRGVGMDVVKASVEDLNGEVRVESTLGAGTTITLVLPLTLAISRALLLTSNEMTMAIPTVAVDSTVKVRPDDIKSVEGKEAIIVRDATVPILRLSRLLGLDPSHLPSSEDALNVVIIAYAQQKFGFIVDELIGEQEIVVKPLGAPLKRVKNVAGAAILGSGDVVVVLHVPDIAALAKATVLKQTIRERAETETSPARKRALIVEDSLTARELERSMFEAAGYEVETAADGLEGLEKLSSQTVDLIVTDVQMPRMDGFEMTSRLKADDRYRDIPVIIVTSRADEADRKRGLEAGADAYFVKSSLSQSDLIECAQRLAG